MRRVWPFNRRRRARSVMRRIITIFGEYDALTELRNRKNAKLLLRAFIHN